MEQDLGYGLEGVACLMDDILIHGKTREEHDKRVLATLERLQKHDITLNKEKCSVMPQVVPPDHLWQFLLP